MNLLRRSFFACTAGILLTVAFGAFAQPPEGQWVQAYQMSPASYPTMTRPAVVPPERERLYDLTPVRGTLRSRLAVSAAGNRLRVRISNEAGATPLVIGGASIALAAGDMDAAPGTMRKLTFAGSPVVTIPPGTPVLSDPVDLPVRVMDELVASVFVEQELPAKPFGGSVLMRTDGNDVLADHLTDARPQLYRPLVSGVIVEAARPTRVVVAFGDSITDASRTTAAQPHGWAYRLAQRLSGRKDSADYAVVSAGIGGNQVLTSDWGLSALARIDRDVFAVPGVTDVILLAGINDIGFAGKSATGDRPDLDVDALIAGYQQIAARAHVQGLKIYIGTLTPFVGGWYQTDFKESQRLRVNDWIRSSRDFDGVIDFEAVIRDPASPEKMKAEYDSGDHLHPGPAGYAAMGDAIDLDLFK